MGYLLYNKLNHQLYFKAIVSKVNLRAYTIGLISKFMSLETKRTVFIYLIISIICYSALLRINMNAKQLKLFNVLIKKMGIYDIFRNVNNVIFIK